MQIKNLLHTLCAVSIIKRRNFQFMNATVLFDYSIARKKIKSPRSRTQHLFKYFQPSQVKDAHEIMAEAKQINHRFVSNIHDEPKQMLKPIAGYEREPLVSLEESCKPLENILGYELEQNILIAKKNSRNPKHGLTSDESAAIHLYTMEWNNRENSLYMVLNSTLRLVDRSKLRPWFRYLKLLLTGLFKLP